MQIEYSPEKLFITDDDENVILKVKKLFDDKKLKTSAGAYTKLCVFCTQEYTLAKCLELLKDEKFISVEESQFLVKKYS